MPLILSILIILSGLMVIGTGLCALAAAIIMMSFRPAWQQALVVFFATLLTLLGVIMFVLPIVWLFFWR